MHLIYFNEVKLQGTIVYLGSQFTGHGSAIDLIRTFKDDYHNLNYVKNLLQVSMDGPNVNWKMLKLVEENGMSKDPLSPDMLELHSCGLHVVYGAYRLGQNSTKFNKLEAWKITSRNFQQDDLTT